MSDQAVVTLDVLHSGVIWGWFVTMNLWAKSVSTGAVLVGAWAAHRFPESAPFYRRWAPIVGFVFLAITLLFTVGDLHQPLRFWHMFLYTNPTSAVAWAGWLLTLYNVLLFGLVAAGLAKRDDWVERLWTPTVGVAFLSTIYTAALLGQANAREVWSTPTEVAQTLLSAALAGCAAYLLAGRPEREREAMGDVFAGAALVSFVIYVGEFVFAPMKSEEAAYTMHLLVSGPLASTMIPGIVFAFGAPVVAWFLRGSSTAARLAAVASLAGLWLVKHAFLIAPQLLPLS